MATYPRPIYEITITRYIQAADDSITLCVHARSADAAVKKAMKIAKKNVATMFGDPIVETSYDSSEPEKLDFVPDCEVY